ncbi:MAG: CCA tRNA nucleotidyltransferase [Planctomycetota bacterium]
MTPSFETAAKSIEWPRPVLDVVRALDAAGVGVLAVGGAVRDGLLGRATDDWDLATASRPQAVAAALESPKDVDLRLGAVHLELPDGIDLTVTTFRSEAEYLDRRHPSRVEFVDDLAVDARRRDFTVNALYLTPAGGLVDPAGGLADLAEQRLRCIGPAAQRFEEDVLRLLRAVRFAAAYDFAIEEGTWRAMQATAPLLAALSPARAYDELTRAFIGQGRGRALRLLVESGLAAAVLPEAAAMTGVPQPPEYHPEGDVLTHVALVLDAVADGDPVQAWAAVLHDIGKPPTFEVAADRIRFHGHDTLSAEMADVVLRRLHAPRELRESVVEICRDHIKFAGVMQMRPARRERWMRSPRFPAHLAFHRADCVGSHGKLDVWAQAQALWQALPPEGPAPLCSGRDVIALGVPPGPRVGRLLRAVQEEVEKLDSADRAVALQILQRLVRSRYGD